MPRHAFSIGIDIGGTATKGVVLLGEKIVTRAVIDTPKKSDDLVAAVKQLTLKLRDDREVPRIGIAVAGRIDASRKEILAAPNTPALCEKGLRLRLARALATPVVLENDANAAAYAEYRIGAGCRGSTSAVKSLALLALGTGVGGGLIINGSIYHGAFGGAAEFGHMIVQRDGLQCSCGRRGCLESYTSLRFLRSRGIDDPRAAQARALKGGRRERKVFEEMGQWLGVGLVSIIKAVDPSVIVVGGGLSALGDLILKPARAAVEKSSVRVVKGDLGRFAGAIGAALLSQKG